jgi:hypothetical protein
MIRASSARTKVESPSLISVSSTAPMTGPSQEPPPPEEGHEDDQTHNLPLMHLEINVCECRKPP